jgi:YD repeat-containing protein
VGTGNGFRITAPADTTSRQLMLFVGGWASAGKLTAHLSDGSAADFVDSSYSSSSGIYQANYTLTYHAASVGQSLTVSWVMTADYSGDSGGNVVIDGAALAGSSSGGGGGSGGPSAPTNVTAAASSPTQVKLTWTASTDSAGVTGYLIERCSGANCTNYSQVGTSSTTSFTDSSLAAGTDYSYEVVAVDSAGLSSSDSAPSSAATEVVYTYSYDSSSRLHQITGTDGSTYTYSYDGNGNVLSVTKSP